MKDKEFNADISDFKIDFTELSTVESSKDLPHLQNDETQLDIRNNVYTSLLSEYTKYLSSSINSKKNYKRCITGFLLFIIALIAFGSIYIYALAIKSNVWNSATDSLAIFTALASFIGSIIIIPMHIVKYIFNENEIQQIGEIIKNIQLYDKTIREDLYKVKFKDIEESQDK